MAFSVSKNSDGKWDLKDGRKVVSTHKLSRLAHAAKRRLEAAGKSAPMAGRGRRASGAKVLGQDSAWSVRWWDARNVNMPPSTLTRLAQDPDADVRQGVARNVITAPSILTRLAQDPDANVRWGVAENPNTPPSVLTHLAQDPNATVREEAAKRM